MKFLRLNNAAYTVARFMWGGIAPYPVWHQIMVINKFVEDGHVIEELLSC